MELAKANRLLKYYQPYANSLLETIKNSVRIIAGENGAYLDCIDKKDTNIIYNGFNMLTSRSYDGEVRSKINSYGIIEPQTFIEHTLKIIEIAPFEKIALEGNCCEIVCLEAFFLDSIINQHNQNELNYEYIFDYNTHHVMLRIIIADNSHLFHAAQEGLVFAKEINLLLPRYYEIIKKTETAQLLKYFDAFILFRQNKAVQAIRILDNLYANYPLFFVRNLRDKMVRHSRQAEG